MQILEPIVHETVWGGTKLASFVETDCRKIGHLYGVIDTKKMCSKFLTGSYQGKTIHEWFLDNRERYGLGNFEELPILTALVEAQTIFRFRCTQTMTQPSSLKENLSARMNRSTSLNLPQPVRCSTGPESSQRKNSTD